MVVLWCEEDEMSPPGLLSSTGSHGAVVVTPQLSRSLALCVLVGCNIGTTQRFAARRWIDARQSHTGVAEQSSLPQRRPRHCLSHQRHSHSPPQPSTLKTNLQKCPHHRVASPAPSTRASQVLLPIPRGALLTAIEGPSSAGTPASSVSSFLERSRRSCTWKGLQECDSEGERLI